MADPILNPGEVIIRKVGGMEYVSLGRISAWLVLTNQRLIIQRLLGSASSYPLSHITHVSQHEHWPSPFAFFPFKLLRIDFDNGGTVLFGLPALAAWIQTIDQAKVSGPEMPYTTAPTAYASQPPPPALRWVMIGMVAVSMLTVCVCTPIFFLIVYIFNSR